MRYELDIRGIAVTRSKDKSTIFLPLPPGLRQEISGGCCCHYCSSDGEPAPAYWDTLAVAAGAPESGPDISWTVHAPEYHGATRLRSEDRPRFTVIVPYVTPALATDWHPNVAEGPFSTLARGNFQSFSAAVDWARDHLNGTPYSIREVK